MSNAKSSGFSSKPTKGSRSIPLATRNGACKGWSNNEVTLASGQEDELEDRPFTKSTIPGNVHQETLSIGEREAQSPRWDV